MTQKLTPATATLLTIPPILWAGNAVVGRVAQDLISPITLNFLRWAIAIVLVAPLGWAVLQRGSGLWVNRRRYLVLGLLGIGLYNGMQYLALHSSTPINVTLVGASMPVWMLLIGLLFFGARVRGRQVAGATLSIAGVATVLSHGDLQQILGLRFVVGDIYMLLATIIWSLYSWFLSRSGDSAVVRSNWATFLMAQMVYGVAWSGVFAAAEWSFTDAYIRWSWSLVAILVYVAIGPAIVAFRCWGAGVQLAGPATAAFFSNLTPLFAALMSLAFLGDVPHIYHMVAFALIVSGIVLSSRAAA
jgi:drug/metabolite transporter (DMT)-like permease